MSDPLLDALNLVGSEDTEPFSREPGADPVRAALDQVASEGPLIPRPIDPDYVPVYRRSGDNRSPEEAQEDYQIERRASAEENARRLTEHIPGGSNAFVRNVAVGAGQAGTDLYGLAARLLDLPAADRLTRMGTELEEAAAVADESSIAPEWLNRGFRGTTRSLTSAVVAPGGSASSMITQAAAIRGNQAITEGKDAGLDAWDTAKYAARAAAIEGGIAGVFQRFGFGGLESMMAGKQLLREGVKGAVKQFGLSTLQELPEEITTEIFDNVNQAVSKVDDKALTPEALQRVVLDTTVQTIMSLGIVHGARHLAEVPEVLRRRKQAETAPVQPVEPVQAAQAKADTLPAQPVAPVPAGSAPTQESQDDDVVALAKSITEAARNKETPDAPPVESIADHAKPTVPPTNPAPVIAGGLAYERSEQPGTKLPFRITARDPETKEIISHIAYPNKEAADAEFQKLVGKAQKVDASEKQFADEPRAQTVTPAPTPTQEANVPSTQPVPGATHPGGDGIPAQGPVRQDAGVPAVTGNFSAGQRVRYSRGKRKGMEATVAEVRPDGRVVLKTDDGKTQGAGSGITPDNLEKIDAPAPQAAATAAPAAVPVPAAPAAADPVVEPAAEAAEPVGNRGNVSTKSQPVETLLDAPVAESKPATKPVVSSEKPDDQTQQRESIINQIVDDLMMTPVVVGSVRHTPHAANATIQQRIKEIAGKRTAEDVKNVPERARAWGEAAKYDAAEIERRVRERVAQKDQPEPGKKAKKQESWLDRVNKLTRKLAKERGYRGIGNIQDLQYEAADILRAESERVGWLQLKPRDDASSYPDGTQQQHRKGERVESIPDKKEQRDTEIMRVLDEPKPARETASIPPAANDTQPKESTNAQATDAPESRGRNGGTERPVGDRAGRSESARPGDEGRAAVQSGGSEGSGSDDADRDATADRERPERTKADRPATEPVGSSEQGEPDRGEEAQPRVVKPKASRPTGFRFQSVEDAMPPKGDLTRARANLDAIRASKAVVAEGREPTAGERAIIARFSGWGSLKWVFNAETARNDPKKWEIFAQAQELMDPTERQEASAANENADEVAKASVEDSDTRRSAIISTLNAHYTNPHIVSQVWEMVQRMIGPKIPSQLRVLEPSVGMGVFIGLEPEAVRGRTAWTAVELEPQTATMAGQVYGDARVINSGFEKLDVPDDSYDLVISNVPFGSYRIYERKYAKQGKPFIHDFFFLKSMDKVRPGGLVAFITSTGTLDKSDATVRKALYEQGDLVHAVRFPADAHKTAGTAVVTDLIVLRKRLPGEAKGDDAWLNVGETPDTKGGAAIPINSWFVKHPELVLGTAERTGKLHGLDRNGEKRPNWTARPTYEQEVRKAIEAAPEAIFAMRQKVRADAAVIPAPEDLKPYAMVEKDGKVYQKQGGDLVLVDSRGKSAARVGWMRRMVESLRSVWTQEMAGEDAKAERAKLNRTYDEGQKEHGRLNDAANARLFRPDPDAANLLALEKLTSDDNDEDSLTWDKGPAFSKPTMRPPAIVGKAKNATQGVAASMGRTGRVDPATVGEAMGISLEAAEEAMRADGAAFEDPTQGWQPKWAYLSGNVKAKLSEAKEAARRDTERFSRNVAALELVQPEDKEASQITPVFGAPWIDPATIQKFLQDRAPGVVAYPGPEGRWLVEGRPSDAANAALGVKGQYRYAEANEIVSAALNGSRVDMSGRTQDGKTLHDKDAEKAATEKANELRGGFIEWMRQPSQSDLMAGVVKSYNDVVNVFHQEPVDHSWITFDGMNPSIVLDGPQRRSVSRAITDGRAMLAHEVGTGKTYSLIASAMEMKRLGISRKPVIATMNNLVDQFARDAAKLYPGKNILTQPPAWGDKGSATSREVFMARLATEDFDLAVISHETLTSLPNDPKTEIERLKEVLIELEAANEALKQRAENDRRKGHNESRAVAALAKRIESAKQRMAEINDHVLKVDNITFEETGIDQLLIDEAHAFKNLPIITSMEGVLGLGGADAKRAEDLLLKTRTLNARNGSDRGLILATGTPISNTMTEVFAFQQMLQPRSLRAAGIHHFDNWARSFGTTKQTNEVQADGTRKSVTRFAEWVNLSGLAAMLSDVMDVTLTSDIPRVMEALPKVKEVPVKVPLTEEQKSYREWTKERLEKIKARGKAEKGDDIALVAMGDALKSAIDMRLVDPRAKESDGSKIPALADGIADLYQNGEKIDGKRPVQFVFQNVQTSPNTWGFSLNQAIKEALVERGIPEKSIAILDGNTTKAVRNRVKAEAATGKYAVLIGSTEVLGTGTNAQAFSLATWHIDTPHRPADVIQRDGRMIRQGNRYKEIGATVRAHRVVTEGTMDEAMWARLGLKKTFIYDALAAIKAGTAQEDMREIETEGLNPELIAAMASGDPDLIRSVELDEEIGMLRRARMAHYNQKDYLDSQARGYDQEAKHYETLARAARSNERAVAGKIPDKPHLDDGTTGKELTKQLSLILDRAKTLKQKSLPYPQTIGKFAGLPVVVTDISYDYESVTYTYGDQSGNASDGSAMLGALRGRAENFADDGKRYEERAAELRKRAETNRDRAAKVGEWPRETEYAAKRAESKEIDTRLASKPAIAKSLTDEGRKRFETGLEARRRAKAEEESGRTARAAANPKKNKRQADAEHAATDLDEPGTDNTDRAEAFDDEAPDTAAGDLSAKLFDGGNVPVRVKPEPLPAKKDDPTKLNDIILDLGKSLTAAGVGKTEFTTAGLRADQKGVYKPSTGQTTIRHNNLDAAAHEIAHRLDDFYGLSAQPDDGADDAKLWNRATKELKWFSYFGSEPDDSLSRSAKKAYYRAEGWAEFVRAWIVNPKAAAEIAPSAVKLLEARLPVEVRASLKEYSDQVRRFVGRPEEERTKANVRGIADAAREAAGKEGVISKFRRALTELAKWAAGRGASGRSADIPDFNTDKGKAFWDRAGERMMFGWFDSLYPALKRYRQALSIRGQKQSDLPLDKDFETLSRLQSGFADRMDSMFVDGLIDQENKPKVDPVTGERMSLEWLIQPASELAATDKQLAALLDDAMAQGVEERTVEEGKRNLTRAQREAEDYRHALYEIDPDDPDIAKKVWIFLKAKVKEARAKNERLTGIAGGLDSDYEQARRALKNRAKGDPEYAAVRKEILRRYRAWADSVMEYAVDAGVIGRDRADALKATHQHYIDLHRVMGEETAALPTKAFKGSSRLIDNPLVNLMHATWSTLEWADRNRVRRSFVDVLTVPRGLHQGEVKDLATIGHKVHEEETKPFSAGGKRDENGKIDGKKPYKVWRKSVNSDGKESVEPEWWVFDPAIEAAFEAAHAFDNPTAIEELMRGLKTLSQKTITSAPNFLIRQVFRDTVSRLVTSEAGSTPLDLVAGYTADLAGRSVMERYKQSGGGQAGWDDKGKEQYQRRLMGEMADLVQKPGHVITTVKALGKGYMRLAAESDLVNRRAEFVRAWRAEYKKQKEAGEDDHRAQFLADLWAAKNARGLMDFAVAGHYARKINRYIVFFNAGMQAMRRMGRALSAGHRGTTALRWGIYAAAPTALLYAIQAAMMDDKEREEWRQRPAEKRDFHWSFKVAPNVWIDIPKPYEWGVGASAIERSLDMASGNKNAFSHYPSSLRTALLPIKEEYLAGTFRPFLEASTNYSYFTGRSIVSPFEEHADLDKRKGTANASGVGQILQNAIGVDARKIDHVIQGTFGGFGRIATAKSGDPGWWAGAATGLTGRSPGWEAEDVQWVMDWGDRRKVGSRKAFTILRDKLSSATKSSGDERDRLSREARAYATMLRKAIEREPLKWGGPTN